MTVALIYLGPDSKLNLQSQIRQKLVIAIGSRFGYLKSIIGGFASKMALASGPVITAMLLGKDNYEVIIIVATIVMLLTVVTVWIPVRLQDHVKTD